METKARKREMDGTGRVMLDPAWFDCLDGWNDRVRLEVYDAAVLYARMGEVPELKPQARLAFSFIRKEMDRQAENRG